jgi:peroxiredoxin
LAYRLAACKIVPGNWLPTYAAMVERLRAADALSGAPGVGQVLPDFVLPDATGTLRRFSDLVAGAPAVLSFNRGSWCPFCEEEVAAWSHNRDRLIAAGGRLIIVTPETGGRMMALAALAGHDAVVLCDTNLGVALLYGLAFPVGQDALAELRQDDLDLALINGTPNGFLPVPATYLVDQDRVAHFAFVDPDFSHRAEPDAVLALLPAIKDRADP